MSAGAWAGLGAAVALATTLGVEWVRRWALRHEVVDVPNARSSHASPTPRGGGIALVCTVGLAWVAAAAAEPALRGWALPVALLLVATVSALDDLRSLPAGWRLGVHALAAGVIIAGYGASSEMAIPGVGSVALGGWGLLLTLIWIVGLTNAYNFMDGVDGIAGMQGVAAGAAWLVLGLGAEVPLVAALGGGIAAGCIGFLVHNWPPARVFLGDVGAATLGAAFAALPLVAAASDHTAQARWPVAGLLPLWPFVYDAAWTLGRRAIHREPLWQAHRTHLYQRLAATGWTHRRVTLLYASLALAGGGAAVAWWHGIDAPAAIVPALSAALLHGLTIGEEKRSRQRSAEGGV